jgi:hypothetical protein
VLSIDLDIAIDNALPVALSGEFNGVAFRIFSKYDFARFVGDIFRMRRGSIFCFSVNNHRFFVVVF